LALKSGENPESVRVAATDIVTSTSSNKRICAYVGVQARLSSDAHGNVTKTQIASGRWGWSTARRNLNPRPSLRLANPIARDLGYGQQVRALVTQT
jgi:hypothetical protein